MPTCPDCGNEYDKIGTHWSHAGYPELTYNQKLLLDGLALGDGSLEQGQGHARLGLIMTNEDYVRWVADALDWLATDVRVHRTSDELEESLGREGDYQDQYIVRTRNHPYLTDLKEQFTGPDGRLFPDDLVMTWTTLKHWIAGDGHLRNREGRRHEIIIGAESYRDQRDTIEDALGSLGLSPTFSPGGNCFTIRLGPDDVDTLFEHTSPPAGFEHKWHDQKP